jgi:hypothetical protein
MTGVNLGENPIWAGDLAEQHQITTGATDHLTGRTDWLYNLSNFIH